MKATKISRTVFVYLGHFTLTALNFADGCGICVQFRVVYVTAKNNKAAVHCMLRPRHPTARCRHPPSSRTRRSQYDKAKTLACARRRNDVTRCNGIDMPPYDVLCANMTSSTKSEVHNVSLAPQPQGTVPRPQVTRTKFGEDQGICS